MSDTDATTVATSDEVDAVREPGWIGTPQEYQWLEAIVNTVLVLNVFDAIMTMVWVSGGAAIEANPFLSDLVNANPLSFVTVKLALVSLGSLLLWRNRGHALAVVAIFVAFLAYYFLLLYHLRALRAAIVMWING